MKLEADVDELSVFVYGTLKPGGRYHQRYCGADLTEAIPALVKGRLYDFPQLGYPAMTAGEDWVAGYVLEFVRPAAVCAVILQRLDALEDYQPGRPADENDYVRCQVQTFSRERARSQIAWGYVMPEERVRSQGGIYLPDGTWPARPQ